MNRSYKTIFSIIFFFTWSAFGDLCQRAKFPKTFGAGGNECHSRNIGYHAGTQSIALGGGTNDPILKYTDTTTTRKPYLILYQGDNFSYIWGKIFFGTSPGTWLFFSIAFSVDGSIIATTTSTGGFIVLVRAIDGGLIDSKSYASGNTNVLITHLVRSLLIKKNDHLDASVIATANMNTEFTPNGFRLIKYRFC